MFLRNALSSFIALLASTALWAQDPLPVIEGTGASVPAYDADQGGWTTEQAADAVSLVLKGLERAFTEDAAIPSEFFADDVNGELPLPEKLESVYAEGSLSVKRRSDQGEKGRFKGREAAMQAFGNLTKRLGSHAHPKFKVTSVNLTGERLTTRVEVLLEGISATANGRLQVNAIWSCDWRLNGEARPSLTKLTVEDYEEVTFSGDTPSLFQDVTEATLAADPAFHQQLAYGVDHWLARLDMRMGIQVGGWNGLAVGDVNGDGLEDVYVCQSGGLPNRLFLQQSDGTAKDVAASAGVDWLESSHGALFLDLDNDGDQDLAVSVGEGVIIQENDGQGGFTVKAAEVLPDAVPYSLAAADYDNDGNLDIFAACYDRRGHVDRNLAFARPVPYHDANNGGRNVLMRNEGSFRFRQVTRRVGLDENNERYSYAAAWMDYDRDGDLDLYVANDFGRNNLYRQDRDAQGQPHFSDVAEASGVLDIAAGMSASWGDSNNDGWPDLYVSNMFSSAGNRIATQTRFLEKADSQTRSLFLRHARGNSLFENPGKPNAVFKDVSMEAAVTQGRWAWGSLFADLTNDGWEDIVVANGFITQEDTGDL